MAKELRLEQVRRDGRGIECDEGLARARAVVMQGTRDDLLAGARFAGDEHGDARAGETADGAEYLLHRRRRAAQLRNARHGHRLDVALRTRARGAPHEIHRMVDVKGLGQILERAAAVGGHRAAQIRVRRHDDDGQRRARLVDPLQ